MTSRRYWKASVARFSAARYSASISSNVVDMRPYTAQPRWLAGLCCRAQSVSYASGCAASWPAKRAAMALRSPSPSAAEPSTWRRRPATVSQAGLGLVEVEADAQGRALVLV